MLNADPVRTFAALGDPTRAALVRRLGDGQGRSIARLSADTSLTRQAVTKHLNVLKDAGLVRAERQGRESRFALDPAPMRQASDWMTAVSAQWDDALDRLRVFVEQAG
jgi:DNA-binding transcriptional ArsR family regulator